MQQVKQVNMKGKVIMKNYVRTIKKSLLKKEGAGKEIIMEVGLAVVGVALLIIFREQLTNLVTSLLTNATTKINDLFSVTVG